MKTTIGVAMAAIILSSVSAMAAPTPADKCEAAKNKIAGAYYACREKAAATAIAKATAPDYDKCSTKFTEKWDGAESKSDDTCPDTVLTASMEAMIAAQATAAAELIAGFASHLVINEIDYDQVGTDDAEFVEIYNGTSSPVSLADLALVFVNGTGSSDYSTVSLAMAGSLAVGQYLVVGTATVNATLPPAALAINFPLATDNIQNGAPDGVALVNTGAQTVVDALSYEGPITTATITGFAGTVNLVEGTELPLAVADSNGTAGSLVRLPNGSDTDETDIDWAFTATTTPGAANIP